MTVEKEVLVVLDGALALKGRSAGFQRTTPLLGALPELDSMAVLGVIAALEDRYGFTIHDDEIDSATFATLGTLVDLVVAKLASQ